MHEDLLYRHSAPTSDLRPPTRTMHRDHLSLFFFHTQLPRVGEFRLCCLCCLCFRSCCLEYFRQAPLMSVIVVNRRSKRHQRKEYPAAGVRYAPNCRVPSCEDWRAHGNATRPPRLYTQHTHKPKLCFFLALHGALFTGVPGTGPGGPNVIGRAGDHGSRTTRTRTV